MSDSEKITKIKLLLDEGCSNKTCDKCGYRWLYNDGCMELYLLQAIEATVNADESGT